MAGNGIPTPPHGSKPFAAVERAKGVSSPPGRFSRHLSSHGSRFELAVYLSALSLLAAVLAGHRLAVLGLVALPLLGCGRQR